MVWDHSLILFVFFYEASFSTRSFFIHNKRASNVLLFTSGFLFFYEVLFFYGTSFILFKYQVLPFVMIMRAPSKLHKMTSFRSVQNILRLSSIQIAYNDVFHDYTKQIGIDYNAVKHHLRHDILSLQRVSSAEWLIFLSNIKLQLVFYDLICKLRIILDLLLSFLK